MKRRSLCVCIGGAAAAMAAFVPAANAASAIADDPIPTFDFSDCPPAPEGIDRPGSFCLNGVVTSGRMAVGGLNLEVTKPIRFTWASFYTRGQGPGTGYSTVFGGFRAEAMKVDDGVFRGPVWAKPTYVGGFETSRFQYKLNLKLELTRPFYLKGCEIGSAADPIKLDLITGTTNPPPPNTPITGSPFRWLSTTLATTKHVDNSFAVPGTSGCFLSGMNQRVNSRAKLPSAAGQNTVIFNEYGSLKRYSELP